MTLLDDIKSLLIRDRTQEAIAQINQLSQQELETQGPGLDGYLFDFAARHTHHPDVFHALIHRYAFVTKNKQLNALAIDCNPYFFTRLDEAFIMGNLPIMRHISLRQYKESLNLQKTLYCHRIADEVKKLAIYGATLLLEVLQEPQKTMIKTAITRYQKTHIDSNHFNSILSTFDCSNDPPLAVKKAKIIQQIAFQLLALTSQFLVDDFESLMTYQNRARDILRSQQSVLQHCRGLGKILTDIGNAIARYSGISLVASFSQGKVHEFMAGRWTLFSIRPKTLRQQDVILNRIDTIPSLN